MTNFASSQIVAAGAPLARVDYADKDFEVSGRSVRLARLREEWYEDVADPISTARALKGHFQRPDVLTFWQRLSDSRPRFPLPMVLDPVAALPITSFSNWWDNQIDAKTRNMARKAEKKGVVIRFAQFDDDFVRGITALFNETPVRQGKPFWHYGKSFETIKSEFSRFLFREEIIAAYFEEELIGFIMLAYADRYAITGQIISKIAHRDKAPTNALLAKAVEHCASKGIPHLVYAKWVEGSLGDFKRSNGFIRVDLPRYYLPITLKGRCYTALGLYRGKALLPGPVLDGLKSFRKTLSEKRSARLNSVSA